MEAITKNALNAAEEFGLKNMSEMIDNLVRDFTKAIPMPKSLARKKLLSFRESVIRECIQALPEIKNYFQSCEDYRKKSIENLDKLFEQS
jgi:hypothetical protein